VKFIVTCTLSDCTFTDVYGFRAAVAGWMAEKSWFYIFPAREKDILFSGVS
jgi:hypothetical protein